MAMSDIEAHPLSGWWKILSFQVEFEDTGERADTYGVEPLGHIVIERDRMMSILTSRERLNSDPAALFETMIAYSGLCCVVSRMRTNSSSRSTRLGIQPGLAPSRFGSSK